MELNELFKKISEDTYLVKQLTNAVTSSYCRQTSTAEKDLVFNALDLITGKQNYRNYSCNQCIFRAFLTVGKEYLMWQQRQTEVIVTPENNTETVEATVTEPKKTVKKSTTKKKSTKKTAAKKRKTQ